MRGSWSSGGGSFHGVGRCVDRHHQVVAAADRVHRRTVATHLDVVRFFFRPRTVVVTALVEASSTVRLSPPSSATHTDPEGAGSGDTVVVGVCGREMLFFSLEQAASAAVITTTAVTATRRFSSKVLSPVPQRAVPSGSSRHALHRRDDFRMPLRRGTIIDHARAIAPPAARFLERIFTEPSSIQRHPCALLELARGGRPRFFAARLCYGLLVRRWCRTSRMRSSPQCGFIFEERSGRR